MSDTSGLPNANADGVPVEDQPERFENGDGQEQNAQGTEPAETEPGQDRTAPEGAEDVTDAATTTIFTDAPLPGGSLVKAVYITQLRTAVNAMRAAAGLGAQSFTDPSLSAVKIKATHLTQLRTALDAARTAIGLPAVSYTDPTITAGSTVLKTVHIADLRNGVK